MTPTQIFTSFLTIIRKEITRFLRIWPQTLVPPAITQSLYFLIFGTFIGSRIGEVGGVDYMEFIIPGLIMMSVITSSFNNVVSSFFGSRFQKNLDEILVSPTPNWVIIAGFTGGGVLRGLLVGLIVFAVSLGFNPDVRIDNIFVVLFFIVITAILFSLGGLTNGIFAKKFDDVAIFATFILTPLTYLGGVFYSLNQLPDFWRAVSVINPIVYMVDGFRAGFSGQSEFGILLDAGLVLLAVVILAGINWYLLRRGAGIKQ